MAVERTVSRMKATWGERFGSTPGGRGSRAFVAVGLVAVLVTSLLAATFGVSQKASRG